jgi:transposase InsO family protein
MIYNHVISPKHVTRRRSKNHNTLKSYKSFEAWAITQEHCKAIRVLRSDRRGEYLSGAFDQHLAAAGTVQRLTVHDTSQFNGVAECLNHTVKNHFNATIWPTMVLRDVSGPEFARGRVLVIPDKVTGARNG